MIINEYTSCGEDIALYLCVSYCTLRHSSHTICVHKVYAFNFINSKYLVNAMCVIGRLMVIRELFFSHSSVCAASLTKCVM